MRALKITMTFMLAGCASAAFAALPVGNARNGLTTMKGLNLIVLQNLNINGQETEGKVYVGGNFTGGGSYQVGFGNSSQGEALSSRPTLSVGGNLTANINLQNRSNGGNGLIGSYGAVVGGSAQSITVQDNGAVVRVGGALGAVALTQGTSLDVGGSLGGNLDLNTGNTVRIGGSVATVQGNASGTTVGIRGSVGTVQTNGGTIRVGAGVTNANLSSNTTLEIVGNLSGGNLGNNNLIKVTGNASNVNGSNGTTLYAGGTISGNANGATFVAGNAGNPAPTIPDAPVVASLAAETAQIQADVRALSTALGGLAIASNPSTLVWSGGFQTATFNAVDNGAGYAVFNVDQTIFNAQQIAYNFASTTLPVIINVANSNGAIHAAQSGVYTLAANFLGNARANNQQVIWNFTDAATLDLQRQFQGSVLAPEAALSANTIEGSVVARMFNQTNEVHLGTYARSISFIPDTVGSVPEPAVWLQMLAGFTLAGLALRGRRIEELA